MGYTDNWNQIKELVKNTRLPAETDEIFLGSFDGCGDGYVGYFLYEWG